MLLTRTDRHGITEYMALTFPPRSRTRLKLYVIMINKRGAKQCSAAGDTADAMTITEPDSCAGRSEAQQAKGKATVAPRASWPAQARRPMSAR